MDELKKALELIASYGIEMSIVHNPGMSAYRYSIKGYSGSFNISGLLNALDVKERDNLLTAEEVMRVAQEELSKATKYQAAAGSRVAAAAKGVLEQKRKMGLEL